MNKCPRCIRGRITRDRLDERTYCINCGYTEHDKELHMTLEDELAIRGSARPSRVRGVRLS